MWKSLDTACFSATMFLGSLLTFANDNVSLANVRRQLDRTSPRRTGRHRLLVFPCCPFDRIPRLADSPRCPRTQEALEGTFRKASSEPAAGYSLAARTMTLRTFERVCSFSWDLEPQLVKPTHLLGMFIGPPMDAPKWWGGGRG